MLYLTENFTFYTLCVFIVVLILSRYVLKNSKLPPGPYGLPLVGYALFLDNRRRAEHVHKLCQYYNTKVLSMNFFTQTVIFIDDYDLIKDCFQRRSDMVDRLDDNFLQMFDEDYQGIIGTSGPVWKESRRFTLYLLRDMGMGKLASESIIQHEAQKLTELFNSYQNQPFNPQQPVNMAVSNIINSMVFGHRFEYDDKNFQKALFDMNELVRGFNDVSIYYVLRNKISRKFIQGTYDKLKGYYVGYNEFVKREIEEHKEKFNGEVNDLIDGYLMEMKTTSRETFNESNLQSLITDLFLAGSETTNTTLNWALLYMAHHPDIQEKVHEELNTVLGDRPPNMTDKPNTPYTEATLNEIQRMNTLVPLGLTHTCQRRDFEIDGYTIPRSTGILANLHQVHRNPAFWKNPEKFDPENFLENRRIINQDYLLPYSLGRRSCAGEALARMELYIFFSSWIQKYKIEPGNKLDDLDGYFHGLIYCPPSFQIRLVER